MVERTYNKYTNTRDKTELKSEENMSQLSKQSRSILWQAAWHLYDLSTGTVVATVTQQLHALMLIRNPGSYSFKWWFSIIQCQVHQ